MVGVVGLLCLVCANLWALGVGWAPWEAGNLVLVDISCLAVLAVLLVVAAGLRCP